MFYFGEALSKCSSKPFDSGRHLAQLQDILRLAADPNFANIIGSKIFLQVRKSLEHSQFLPLRVLSKHLLKKKVRFSIQLLPLIKDPYNTQWKILTGSSPNWSVQSSIENDFCWPAFVTKKGSSSAKQDVGCELTRSVGDKRVFCKGVLLFEDAAGRPTEFSISSYNRNWRTSHGYISHWVLYDILRLTIVIYFHLQLTTAIPSPLSEMNSWVNFVVMLLWK